jgi:hypothetical protein
MNSNYWIYWGKKEETIFLVIEKENKLTVTIARTLISKLSCAALLVGNIKNRKDY